ncbi:head-tail adaptor protein [Pseudooceanicola nanhaiensis]|uniref:head-tail adaptor protein n=1 Tax=Pseudooceanicola nanhaiensis TaxID=375761 RepID=UPI004059A1A5
MMPRLNRKLVLEAPVRVADGAGGFVETWVALGEVWAEVIARSGRVHDGGGLPLARTSYKVTVRSAPVGSDARPLPQQRFREGARVFRIETVADRDLAGAYLTCFVREEALT